MANRIIDVLPASWFKREMKQQVIDFLRSLPIDPEDRKKGLMDWCRVTDSDCVAEDYSRVMGLPAGEI